jgi:hypothetical protein
VNHFTLSRLVTLLSAGLLGSVGRSRREVANDRTSRTHEIFVREFSFNIDAAKRIDPSERAGKRSASGDPTQIGPTEKARLVTKAGWRFII